MSPSPPTSRYTWRLKSVALPTASALLYALAFTGKGYPFSLLAFIALVPLLLVADGRSPLASGLGGAAVGAAVYAILCPWLGVYHPAALALVLVVEALWFGAVTAVASLLLKTKRVLALPAIAFVWAASEILRASGFLAFPYGTLPYSLAYSRAALAVASIGGTPLVGLAIAFANVAVFAGLRHLAPIFSGAIAPAADSRNSARLLRGAALRASFGILCIATVIVLGAPRAEAPEPGAGLSATTAPTAPASPGTFRVALVQPVSGDISSVAEYRAAFHRLGALSDGALRFAPDMVAWHETAIEPPLEWHARRRPDRDTYDFVADVRAYLTAYPKPLLIGNAYVDPADGARSREYNSAVLYQAGGVAGRYDKVKLVPFTEYFPWEASMPGFARWLILRFGAFWTQGSGSTIIDIGKARVAAPICFEDSFARFFSSFDAPDFFVVLTNDSWAGSEAMQRQHAAMSIYRAAETGSAVLRVADTGSTAAIAPNGAVVAALPAFELGVLYVDIPLGTSRTTVYEAIGKNIDIVIVCIALSLLFATVAIGRDAFRIDKNDRV